jgi:ribosome-binding factor A
MARHRPRGGRDLRAAADPDSFFGSSLGDSSGKAAQKARMLCRQVQEAASDALASIDDEVLLDLWVCDVREPAGGGPITIVLAGARAAPGDVMARLARVAGLVRGEIASAITRKRVPAIAFELAPDAGDGAHDGAHEEVDE